MGSMSLLIHNFIFATVENEPYNIIFRFIEFFYIFSLIH
jgi:hypothetical protein